MFNTFKNLDGCGRKHRVSSRVPRKMCQDAPVLKIRVRATKPSNLQQLEAFAKEEWGNIPQTCRNLVET
ncbi:uncharacterized [Tachysurus ichikawai]